MPLTARQKAHTMIGQLPDASVAAVIKVMTRMLLMQQKTGDSSAVARNASGRRPGIAIAKRHPRISLGIKCQWDSEADVWCATSKDIPGLVLESERLDSLKRRVRQALPELLRLNGMPHKSASYVLSFQTENG